MQSFKEVFFKPDPQEQVGTYAPACLAVLMRINRSANAI
jgi:hypothetical protein